MGGKQCPPEQSCFLFSKGCRDVSFYLVTHRSASSASCLSPGSVPLDATPPCLGAQHTPSAEPAAGSSPAPAAFGPSAEPLFCSAVLQPVPEADAGSAAGRLLLEGACWTCSTRGSSLCCADADPAPPEEFGQGELGCCRL